MMLLNLLFLFLCIDHFLPADGSEGNMLRILSIGDSLDRFLLQDWCEGTKPPGELCLIHQHNDTDSPIPTNCSTSLSYPTSLYSHFEGFPRVQPWDVAICENFHQNVALGFLFNTQAVSPYPPWHMNKISEIGIDDYDVRRPKTVRDAFNHFQAPALPGLLRVMGGRPHAISLNSCLWDIVRSVNGHICPNLTLRQDWSASWARNASELVDVIREHFPEVKWMGWRKSPKIMQANPPCRLQMIKDVNVAARQVVRSKKLHWEPWLAEHPLVNIQMRDGLHPGPPANLYHMNHLIKKIKQELRG